MQKLLTFFSKNISTYAIFNDQSFNNMFTNDFFSFEKLGPACLEGENVASLMFENRSNFGEVDVTAAQPHPLPAKSNVCFR